MNLGLKIRHGTHGGYTRSVTSYGRVWSIVGRWSWDLARTLAVPCHGVPAAHVVRDGVPVTRSLDLVGIR